MSGEYQLPDGCFFDMLRGKLCVRMPIEKQKTKYTGSRKALRELKKARGKNEHYKSQNL